MRLFVAIPIPDHLKRYAASIRKELEKTGCDVKWVETENYHLTLKFLGDVPDELLEQLNDFLERAAVSSIPFKIRLKRLGFFPNRRRPRVIWIGVEGELERAQFLGERVDAYLSTFGFDAEEKRSFHLTLGRIRSESNLDQLLSRALSLNETIESNLFAVKEFHLMESQLSRQGPTYQVKGQFFLE